MKSKKTLASLTPDATIKQITSAGTYSADLLASIGLHPGKHQDQTLRAVCRQRQWSEYELLNWLKKKDKSNEIHTFNSAKWSSKIDGNTISDFCNYLLETYHSFEKERMKEASTQFSRVLNNNGGKASFLKAISTDVYKLEETTSLYLSFEEKKFIPLAKKLDGNRTQLLEGTLTKIQKSFDIIERDQNRITVYMQDIRTHIELFQRQGRDYPAMQTVAERFEKLFTSFEHHFSFEQEFLIPKVKMHIKAI